MGYGLPKSVEINDQNFSIRYDFRVILTIFEVLDDEELSDEERAYTALRLFFVDFDSIPDYDEAIKQLFWFINGGQYPDDKKKEPEIIDWAKDFQFIVSPVNRVLGKEIRESEYDPDTNTGGTHWFTFLSAYMEIGDCGSQAVRSSPKFEGKLPVDAVVIAQQENDYILLVSSPF